ncbi:SID1 transmembrane family member 1-like isoform X2 [Bolinopsis microptera]|uniref:SID1 transmembrane family member 1-like isoform X2 n=1 Tax=Bolinopsis microptera TaxID=2820187 RepID=UPI00307A1B3E
MTITSLILVSLVLLHNARAENPNVIAANLSQTITANVTATFQKTFFFLLDADIVTRNPVRISAKAVNASVHNPLIVTARQILGVISFTIPLNDEGYQIYNRVARTLCPQWNVLPTSDLKLFLAVDVSSSENVKREFQLRADYVDNFELIENQKITANVTPSTPMYFKYKFKPNQLNGPVLVRVTSDSDTCATISVQADVCPIHDLMYDIEYDGMFQSMTRVAAITVTPGFSVTKDFVVVVVVHPTDYTCEHLGHELLDQIRQYSNNSKPEPGPKPAPLFNQRKNVIISVESTMTYREYIFPTLITIGLLLIIYLLAYVGTILETEKFIRGFNIGEFEYQNMSDGEAEAGEIPPTEDASKIAPTDYGSTTSANNGGYRRHKTNDSMGSVDYCEDLNDVMEIRRTKVELNVADLSVHSNDYKYRLYQWNLIPIAIFYALPVIQLVAGIQLIVHFTGNQDICYYNYLCSRPLGVVQQFNNIFSNCGYVLLGFLFLLIVKHRDTKYQAAVKERPILGRKYGLPQHNGIYYSVGFSLCMEGLLSASYHVCPTGYNFQFDSTFMYLMAGLLMLKIYQLRHPDVNPHAYTAYIFLSFTVLIEVVGVYVQTIYFWICFAVLYIVATLYFTSHMYYMGVISLDCGIFARISHFFRTDFFTSPKPLYMDRFVFLVLVVTLNFAAAILGVVFQPGDFPSFLLAVFLINLLAYFAYYVIMKFIHSEYPYPITIFCGALTMLTWICALYFYFSTVTNWQLPAALSRVKNMECLVLDFYDNHDVWHIISSMALFFGFVTVLTLDDHLLNKPRDQIKVF